MNRGDVVDVELPELGRRQAEIVTRDVAIEFLANVTVASITTRIRGLPTEVFVDREQGLDDDCVVICDNLFTLPKAAVVRVRGELGPDQRHQLDSALATALGIDY